MLEMPGIRLGSHFHTLGLAPLSAGAGPARTPKGFYHPAQGCAARATLGKEQNGLFYFFFRPDAPQARPDGRKNKSLVGWRFTQGSPGETGATLG